MKIYQSPYLPNAVVTAGTNIKAKYAGNFTGTLGVVFSKEAVGAAELMSIQVRTDYVPTHLADLIVGKMAVGFGILNPASAVLIATTGSAVLDIYGTATP